MRPRLVAAALALSLAACTQIPSQPVADKAAPEKPVAAFNLPSRPVPHRLPVRANRSTRATYPVRLGTSGSCLASYYYWPGHDPYGAASRTWPKGTRILVRYGSRSVIVRVNDYGPFGAGRCLDLQPTAFGALAPLGSGVIPVRWSVLK